VSDLRLSWIHEISCVRRREGVIASREQCSGKGTYREAFPGVSRDPTRMVAVSLVKVQLLAKLVGASWLSVKSPFSTICVAEGTQPVVVVAVVVTELIIRLMIAK
jgi:hypothetical protein